MHFRQAAGLSVVPPARNNWALCRDHAGDYQGALAILDPLLGIKFPLPFPRSLASLVLTALGRRDAVRRLLDAAIRDFDQGLRDQSSREPSDLSAWSE